MFKKQTMAEKYLAVSRNNDIGLSRIEINKRGRHRKNIGKPKNSRIDLSSDKRINRGKEKRQLLN